MLLSSVRGGGGTSFHLRGQECPLWFHTPALSQYRGFYCWAAEPGVMLWWGLLAEPELRHFVPVFTHLLWLKTCWLVAEEGIFSLLLVIIN